MADGSDGFSIRRLEEGKEEGTEEGAEEGAEEGVEEDVDEGVVEKLDDTEIDHVPLEEMNHPLLPDVQSLERHHLAETVKSEEENIGDANYMVSIGEQKKFTPRSGGILDEKVMEAPCNNSMNNLVDNHSSGETNVAAKHLCNSRYEGSDFDFSDNDDAKRQTMETLSNKMDCPASRVDHKEQQGSYLSPASKIVEHSMNESLFLDASPQEGSDSGTENEQSTFRKEVETFYRENCLEFKAPKFYREDLNLLKLWRAVVKLGGYEQVTSCKLWRQVGESFRPPKTCTTVSWTFRIFYEKALLEYERHKVQGRDVPFLDGSLNDGNQSLGSGRARRDAAARAMQGWHSQRLLSNGQDKNLNYVVKDDKQQKMIGLLKRKKASTVERAFHMANLKATKPQMDVEVFDVGPPADWVKINVQRSNDCFEVYALVPGLLRDEVQVNSDPAGRLIISGQPEQHNNPWGISPFKKVVSLPCRIDPVQASAVVTLHGQLFVRIPMQQQDV